jgi:phosphatidylinositol alpha-1,6-mannosyltransferase
MTYSIPSIKKHAATQQRVVLLAWEFSRKGGIEEVSRQVAAAVSGSSGLSLSVFKFPRGNKLALLARQWIKATLDRDAVYFFMHPYIFQQFGDVWSRENSPKAVVWAHGIEVWGNFGKANASALPFADMIIASSIYTKDRVLENFPTTRISVVPLAAHCKPTYHFRSTDRPFEVLTVGRLAGEERYKGHDLVLEALALLKKRGHVVRYSIVGSGNDLRRLQLKARELGLSEQVVFHGYLKDSDTAKIYARSSVFAMPSHVIKRDYELWSGEGLGLVYLEAAGHGLPVIACDEGGQRDCVMDGMTGFLVPPDAESIAGKIEYLKKNHEECRKMGEAGRRLVAFDFTARKFREGVLDAIRKAASPGEKRVPR